MTQSAKLVGLADLQAFYTSKGESPRLATRLWRALHNQQRSLLEAEKPLAFKFSNGMTPANVAKENPDQLMITVASIKQAAPLSTYDALRNIGPKQAGLFNEWARTL